MKKMGKMHENALIQTRAYTEQIARKNDAFDQ